MWRSLVRLQLLVYHQGQSLEQVQVLALAPCLVKLLIFLGSLIGRHPILILNSMLSLLGSVMATMSESNLGNVTKAQILAWKSVIQDLMEVGFNLGFVIGRLQQVA